MRVLAFLILIQTYTRAWDDYKIAAIYDDDELFEIEDIGMWSDFKGAMSNSATSFSRFLQR